MNAITPAELDALLSDAGGRAFVDVSDEPEYNEAHIPGFSCVPRSQIEARFERLVPSRRTPVVLADVDGRRAELAARTVERMGYEDVSVLAGGVARWALEEFPTEWGVNVPSKDFGEKVHVHEGLPELRADQIAERMRGGERFVFLDARTPEEHHAVTVPGSRCVPGAELPLRIGELASDPGATVVVHCAGRTRSIIGASVLHRMGATNVFEMTNGTAGWRMAGLELEYGSDRVSLPAPTAENLARAESFADRIVAEDGVRYLSVEELDRRMSEGEPAYLIDVRTVEEYEAGHIPGFWWIPGGQAVQRSDDAVAVRDADIVFACDGRVRSAVTAAWYRRMGFPNVYAVRGGTTAWAGAGNELNVGRGTPAPFGYAEALDRCDLMSPPELSDGLHGTDGLTVIYVGPSERFAAAHVPGSAWVPRARLELLISDSVPDRAAPVVATCSDGAGSVLAADTLAGLGYGSVRVLEGGVNAWAEAEMDVEQGLTGVMSPPNDVIYSGTHRSISAGINYLRWETELGHKYEQD
jgi:rhodanese-related sulfurtransferase